MPCIVARLAAEDAQGQLAAVREVFAEIHADKVPELIVINKADVADPMVIARLRQREPHSVVVSAKTGEGVRDALLAVEADLPRPGIAFEALLPYERGDLLNRIHEHGEVARIEHTGDGTVVHGRVHADLAGELEPNPASLSDAIREGKQSFEDAGGPRAYFGWPADATAKEGRESVRTLGGLLAELVLEEPAVEEDGS